MYKFIYILLIATPYLIFLCNNFEKIIINKYYLDIETPLISPVCCILISRFCIYFMNLVENKFAISGLGLTECSSLGNNHVL